VDRAIEANVLLQIEHLRSYPPVAAALAARNLKLHGWVYRFESGEVRAYDPIVGRFVPISEKARIKGLTSNPPDTPAAERTDESI
jgi:carbonic anhydrase